MCETIKKETTDSDKSTFVTPSASTVPLSIIFKSVKGITAGSGACVAPAEAKHEEPETLKKVKEPIGFIWNAKERQEKRFIDFTGDADTEKMREERAKKTEEMRMERKKELLDTKRGYSYFHIKSETLREDRLDEITSKSESSDDKKNLMVKEFNNRVLKNIRGKQHKYTFQNEEELIKYLRMKAAKNDKESETVKLDVINTGQGSANVLRRSVGRGEKEALFNDLGTSIKNIDEFIKNSSFGKKKDAIFNVILSHGHADHTGGRDISSSIQASAHINRQMAKNVPHSGYSFNILATGSRELKIIHDKMKSGKKESAMETDKLESLLDYISSGLSKQSMVSAPKDNSKYNEDSSMLRLSFGDTAFILPGDAVKEDVREFMESAEEEHIVLVSSHHGSRTGNTPEILKRAEEVIISAGENNIHNLPSAEGLYASKKKDKRTSLPDGTPIETGFTGAKPISYSTENMKKEFGSIVVKSSVFKKDFGEKSQIKAVYIKRRGGEIDSESRYGDGGKTKLLNILSRYNSEYLKSLSDTRTTRSSVKPVPDNIKFIRMCILSLTSSMGRINNENSRLTESIQPGDFNAVKPVYDECETPVDLSTDCSAAEKEKASGIDRAQVLTALKIFRPKPGDEGFLLGLLDLTYAENPDAEIIDKLMQRLKEG